MKKYLFSFFCMCLFFHSYAQKFELNVDAYTGLFHYSGNSASATSVINEGNPDYTINPYGSKNAFSYGGGFRLQYVTKGGFITGLQSDYEILRSKVDINGYQPFYAYTDGPYYYNITQINTSVKANGQSYLQSQDINLSPYIGYRINANKIKIDLMPGIDIGFNLNAYDKGNATDDNNQRHTTDNKLPDLPTDLRLRFGAAAIYKQFGITASYAHGLNNLYAKTLNGGNYSAHSELIRFGLSYRVILNPLF